MTETNIQTLITLVQLQDPQKQQAWVKEHRDFFINLEKPVKELTEQILGVPIDLICLENREAEQKKSLNDYEKGLFEGEEKCLNQIVQRLNLLGYSLEEMKTITDLTHSQLIEKVDQFKEAV